MLEVRMPSIGVKGTPRFLNPRPPDPPTFAIASLWVLLILSGTSRILLGFLFTLDEHERFNIEDLLLIVLGTLSVLCLASIVGLNKLRPWGWWIGMAALGIPLLLGVLLLLLMFIPAFGSLLGIPATPDRWPFSIAFLVWVLPGISLWGRRSDLIRPPGRSGK